MPDGGTQVINLADIKADISTLGDSVKNFAEDVNKKMAAGQELTGELKTKVDQALTEQNNLKAIVTEIEQKMARRGSEGQRSQASMTPGEIFVENDRVKEFMASRSRGRVRVDLAAITTATAGATRDVLVPPDRRDGILSLPDRRLTVRDLITPGRTNSNAIQYVREKIGR